MHSGSEMLTPIYRAVRRSDVCWACEDWWDQELERRDLLGAEWFLDMLRHPNKSGGIGYEGPGAGEDADDLPGDDV